MGGSFGIDDYFQETDGDEADDEFDQITMASGGVTTGGNGTETITDRPQMLLSVPPQVIVIFASLAGKVEKCQQVGGKMLLSSPGAKESSFSSAL